MQTFVPEGMHFVGTAKALDRQRLGKQRVEAWQILKALNGESKGWVNHPAVKMWRGYEEALALYGGVMCAEWINRGYKDSMILRFYDVWKGVEKIKYPDWLNDPLVMQSHRSNLIRKFPEHYSPLWPTVPSDLPYVWPV